MSFEQDLKETFMRHAEDVRPDIESWPAVEKKVRRNHYARAVTASVATVALIAVAAILLPRVGSRTKPHGYIVNPKVTEAPGQTYTIKPVAGKTTYVNTQEGWVIQYPTAWNLSLSDPGRTEFAPKGNSNAGVFVASVRLESGDYRSASVSTFGNQFVTPRSVTIAGMPAIEVTVKVNGGTQLNDISYQLDWTGKCGPASTAFITGSYVSTAMCPPSDGPAMLIVDLNGTTDPEWSSYRSQAEEIVNSLRPLSATSGETGPFHSINGSAASLRLDAFSKTLLQFMEARVSGTGAEAYMCCTAPNAYASLGGLYDNGGRIVKYSIQYDPSVAGTGNERRIGVFVSYAGGRTQTELVMVDVQSDGSVKVSEACNGCGAF